MDFDLFSKLVHNLLYMNTHMIVSGEYDFLSSHMIIPSIQDVYSKESISRIIKGDQEGDALLDLKDRLGISSIIYRNGDNSFFIGPYVTRDFIEPDFREILRDNGFSASYISSIKMYYSSFPMNSRKDTLDTVLGIIKSLSDMNVDPVVKRIRPDNLERNIREENRMESPDYLSVYKRYELENRFLNIIESGESEHLMSAFEDMNTEGIRGSNYSNSIYQDPMSALSILRTLARKAAERGGASVIEINEITQRATQKVLSSKNIQDASRASHDMLLELTEAVRRSKERINGSSEQIRIAVDYIRMNYSKRISLDDLSKISGYSREHLSMQFKKEMGMTISEFIASIRMDMASRLLLRENISIQEISAYVGYLDNNYFVKVFKSEFGMTPSEYRKKSIQTITKADMLPKDIRKEN